MSPLKNLYILRVILGLIAGALSAVLAYFTDPTFTNPSTTTFINCITVAIALYLVSFYALRAKFKNVVEKQSQIMTMGIGIYFFLWFASMIIFFTIIQVLATSAV